MAYEIEPYGLRVVLVEPGFVRTNFSNVVAKRSQSPKSLYSKITEAASVEKMKLNSCPPELVADAVLKAVTSKEPNLRYLVGKDVELWMKQKKNMSDKEFFNVIKQSLQ
jgi:NAD(P)-dependent dehydrogenase (short-subunit alcohol dehydrogenase family)